MNHSYPVYTVENECHDCYKCIRHCPAKAIRLKDGSASVIPELCVACGYCVKICPAGAKRIRDDLSRAKFLLTRKNKVYVSLAPSWRSTFPHLSMGQMADALRKLGFAGVSETALGAQEVSARTARIMKDGNPGIYLSSACPAAVDFIRKYIPEHAANIIPVTSPALTHARQLRQLYGNEIGIIFIGPCAAKKQEADRHPELLDLALTFTVLSQWLEENGIDPAAGNGDGATFVPTPAEEGKIYAIEGGMADTVRDPAATDCCYLTISGLSNLDQILGGKVPDTAGKKVFIECLACDGGCINGPGMPQGGGKLEDIIRIAAECPGHHSSLDRQAEVLPPEPFPAAPVSDPAPSEAAIKAALAAVGKYTVADELNCGGCGYQTCRGFAQAVISGKAEASMCLSHLRKLAQKKSNALIKYIPAGVVIFDRQLNIIECNRRFAELFDDSTVLAYEARPGMSGVDLRPMVPFAELFDACLTTGGEITRENYLVHDRILDISIFTVEPHQIAGAVIQDVTQAELHREQIAQKAREVIQKNITTVQRIANYLGEHMAETEILLREVASGYQNPKPKPKVKVLKGADDDRQ